MHHQVDMHLDDPHVQDRHPAFIHFLLDHFHVHLLQQCTISLSQGLDLHLGLRQRAADVEDEQHAADVRKYMQHLEGQGQKKEPS